jgi:hypothetical protein
VPAVVPVPDDLLNVIVYVLAFQHAYSVVAAVNVVLAGNAPALVMRWVPVQVPPDASVCSAVPV